jgi:FixJ family two-component response regulator
MLNAQAPSYSSRTRDWSLTSCVHRRGNDRDRSRPITSVFYHDFGPDLACRRVQQAVNLTMVETAVVHIIDDDESVRMGLDTLLRSVEYKTLMHGSVNAFLKARRPDVLGCLMLDVRLPGVGGLDFQAQLSELGIRLPVVLMTGHGDIPMTVRAMKAGAVDFLTKPFRDQDILDAVAVAVERDRARRRAEAEGRSLREKYASLSQREQDVMRLVTAGKMNKQVAGELDLSEITVKIHRGSAMRKMGARTLADLVRLAEALRLGTGERQ